jgi:hypothetical protein
MAGGAVVQIISVGIQDNMLTATPDLTYWKSSHKQYTPFATESIEQLFQNQCDFGRRATCLVGRAGDLLEGGAFQCTLPQIDVSMGANNKLYARWLDYIGEHMIQEMTIEVGSQVISRYFGDYMHIWNQLTMPEAKLPAYYKLIGHTTQLTYLTDPDFANINSPCSNTAVPGQTCVPRNALPETTLYIPLMFWFCQNPGMALPILALQFHEVKINVSIRPILECLWAVTNLSATRGGQSARAAYSNSLVTASMYMDYVFCDVDERKTFVAEPHEYLFDQLQFSGDITVGTAATRLGLNFSHPVQELIVVCQPDCNVDYCASFEGGEALFQQLGVQAFNYTDALDILLNSIHTFGSPAALNDVRDANGDVTQGGFVDQYTLNGNSMWGFQQPSGAQITNSTFSGTNFSPYSVIGYTGISNDQTAGNGVTLSTPIPNQLMPFAPTPAPAPVMVGLSDPAIFVLSETAFNMHCWGENPIITLKLTINNQERFTEREGAYFDVYQPYKYHTRAPDSGINIYSFAINPESLQPNGTLNFSRVDNAFLILTLSAAAISNTATVKIRIYARAKNVIRMLGGMLGVAFAS